MRGAQLHGLFVAEVGGLGVGRDVDAAEFVSLVDAQAHGDVEDLGDHPGDGEGVGKHGQSCERLDAQQFKASAVEQSVDLVRGCIRGEEADEERSDDAAH